MGAGNLTALYARRIKYAFRQLYRNAWYNGTTRTYVIPVRPEPKRQDNSTYGAVVPFMIVNIMYHQGNYQDVIDYGTEIIGDKKKISNKNDVILLTGASHFELKNYTESLGLIYLSTPFSRSAANFLNEIGVEAFKIGSGEADNLPLIEHIAKFGKPVIMSTGMHSFNSLKSSVDIIESYGLDYALLECTSAYPTPPETVRLSAITEIKQRFPSAIVGFSDHSIGTTMPIAACALGAKIIEKHFTDTRYREGPDIICSMDPTELRFLIDRSFEIHQALQSKKEQLSIEKSVYQFARSSVVADRDIKKGQKIVQKDIWARRPGNGEIAGYDYGKVIGMIAKIDIVKNKQLSWSDLSQIDGD